MYTFKISEERVKYVKEQLEQHYYANPKGTVASKGYKFIEGYDTTRLKEGLTHLYHVDGLGYKMIVKTLGIDKCSYSSLRTLFGKLNIEARKGTNVVTEKLRQMRSENVLGDKNPWHDWTNKKPEMLSSSKRYLCGWYFNRAKQKDVYLRSSWEYAYANWLDNNGYNWDVEVCSYLLKDGRYYRPDFFLYKDNKLVEIIEIKARYIDQKHVRIDKYNMFIDEYSISSRIMYKEDLFNTLQISYNRNIKDWKNIRRIKNEPTN
jgi:hypothetical protein